MAGLGGEETVAGAEFFAGIGNCREFSGMGVGGGGEAAVGPGGVEATGVTAGGSAAISDMDPPFKDLRKYRSIPNILRICEWKIRRSVFQSGYYLGSGAGSVTGEGGGGADVGMVSGSSRNVL